ncbi:hypothetical protein, partial [Bradyrhizobium sp. JYMT SZCCT0428]|uniref:hypothetical protein n=1 Tax=Bradyrhizobium sp. JYMT SZCCT0428 TaxID=2807673 RepID=UPI001BA7260C
SGKYYTHLPIDWTTGNGEYLGWLGEFCLWNSVSVHYLSEAHKRKASRGDHDLVRATVTIYTAIAAIAVAMLGAAFIAGIIPVAHHGIAYFLIFAGAVCPSPRMPLRAAVNARDSFVWTEGVDLVRRVAILAVTIAMLSGLSFAAYGALSLFIWVTSIAALVWLARPHGFALQSGVFLRGLLFLRRKFRKARGAVVSSSAEFVISIFPYYLPAATGDGAAIVAFDMFYKVSRFAMVTYLIGAETALPHQTRALHNENASGLGRATAAGFVLGLVPMTLGIVAVSMFGERIFGTILNHSGIVSPTMRMALCAMLVFMLIQTTCAFVLVGARKFEALARRASITLAGMALISVLMFLFHGNIDTFIVAYVCVYGGGALLYAACLYSLSRCGKGTLTPSRWERKSAMEMRQSAVAPEASQEGRGEADSRMPLPAGLLRFCVDIKL